MFYFTKLITRARRRSSSSSFQVLMSQQQRSLMRFFPFSCGTCLSSEMPALVHGLADHGASDLPATRKLNGTASFTLKLTMCPSDMTQYFMLVDPRTFDPQHFTLRSNWNLLKYSFRARDSDEQMQAAILQQRGMMVTKHVIRNIFFKAGMFNAVHTRAERQPLKVIADVLNSMWWPPSIGRLPKNIIQSSSSKADQWRTLISVLFVAIFQAWEVDGVIPNIDAPRSLPDTKLRASQKLTQKLLRRRLHERLEDTVAEPTDADYENIECAEADRNISRHYDNLLQFTAAVRILSTQSITPDDVDCGCDYLNTSFQSWARMGCHLTPYFHFATHLRSQFLHLGPAAYTTAVWAYERNNGDLMRVHHNGHSGGELEATMMRAWWKRIQVVNLVRSSLLPSSAYQLASSL
ncbi:hypothetical protein BC834DRAFT_845560 [Gloeopeniophorella convolvens]|nr:hypothetical protein BC834DRAFT_845560 [Gloeopeniophorella convolvens]